MWQILYLDILMMESADKAELEDMIETVVQADEGFNYHDFVIRAKHDEQSTVDKSSSEE